MATFLYRLGRLAFRRRWRFALLWAVVLAAGGAGAVMAPAAPDDSSAMSGIEAQQAYDLIQQRFPGSAADGASARIVFVAPDGQKVTAGANKKAITDFVREATGSSPQVSGAVSPFTADTVSDDGSTAYATVSYKVASSDLTDASKTSLEHAIDDARDAGLTVEAGGDVLAAQTEAGGSSEVIGIVLAAVVLLITFGSLAAAGLPLLTAILGVGLSMTAVTALGSALGLSPGLRPPPHPTARGPSSGRRRRRRCHQPGVALLVLHDMRQRARMRRGRIRRPVLAATHGSHVSMA